MIRQDKITFLISTFETPELYFSFISNEFVHDNAFNPSEKIIRVFKRIGIVSRFEKNPSKILTKYIPVNKHEFLKKTLLKFLKDYCLENSPICEKCYLNLGCDYYNKKNDWVK